MREIPKEGRSFSPVQEQGKVLQGSANRGHVEGKQQLRASYQSQLQAWRIRTKFIPLTEKEGNVQWRRIIADQ